MTAPIGDHRDPTDEAAADVVARWQELARSADAAFAALGEQWRQIMDAMTPAFRLLFPERPARCYGPPSLAINGHAYRRRTRRRRQ